MNYTQIVDLLIEQASIFGLAVLAILTAVVGIGVAYLIYWLGWRAIKNTLMGSYGEAFNLHGEAKRNKKRDSDGFASDGSYVDPLISSLYDENKKYGRIKNKKGEPF